MIYQRELRLYNVFYCWNRLATVVFLDGTPLRVCYNVSSLDAEQASATKSVYVLCFLLACPNWTLLFLFTSCCSRWKLCWTRFLRDMVSLHDLTEVNTTDTAWTDSVGCDAIVGRLLAVRTLCYCIHKSYSSLLVLLCLCYRVCISLRSQPSCLCPCASASLPLSRSLPASIPLPQSPSLNHPLGHVFTPSHWPVGASSGIVSHVIADWIFSWIFPSAYKGLQKRGRLI